MHAAQGKKIKSRFKPRENPDVEQTTGFVRVGKSGTALRQSPASDKMKIPLGVTPYKGGADSLSP